jgi:hypothetical protein
VGLRPVVITERWLTVVLNFGPPLLILLVGGGRPRNCLLSLIMQVGTV